MKNGLQFSIATARNLPSALYILGKLPMSVPISLMNSACCYDIVAGEYLAVKGFPHDIYAALPKILRENDMTGFANVIEDNLQTMYYEQLERFPEPARGYYEKRLRDKQRFPESTQYKGLYSFDEISGESVVFFCIKETKERLFSVVEQIRAIPGLYAPFYKDKYTEYWLCECARADASKAAAVRDLKMWGGYDKVVCFGDDVNDLLLFEISDECYAVANAAQEIKAKATAIIGSNDEYGVAKWLEGDVP
jgi:hydroxymethylpyrimidine pyrophosphatase-like HAD family hydrolase